ncbi:APC family permease [Mycolicibacterium mageritense]|uniref:Putrescine importer PuuP n=1 Tax=Mycolicibacterium mageritense TaxID=53462 RepID=A0AAI8XPH2_MYCME|nr:APC family permease [Mycolicibacterium mageritense]BDY29965.1 Putrescine importer PuuP [Mycolicibacterium mageritense]
MTEAHLARRLTLPSVVAFGVSYMAPSLVMVIFGLIAVASAGTAPTAFALATAAMLVTAMSYAKMARCYPVSGSAYFYARHTLGSPVGFLVGWSVLLDYLFLPMVAWLTQSILLNAQFPAVPIWAWMLINAGFTTIVNVVGIVVADRVNKVLTAVALFLVLLFFAYCVTFIAGNRPVSHTDPIWNTNSTIAGVSAAAAIAAYSFLGFDAVTTLSEETKDPKRTIPRAVILVVAIGGLLFVGGAYIMQLVHPGDVFEDAQAASYTMSIDVGGQFYADWTNLGGIIAGSASCLAVQLSTSRLLYIMGRDGVLPKRVFGYVSPRTLTPVYCVLLTGAMCFVGLNLSLQTATGFINFGAFTAFTAVNVCVIAYYLRHRPTHRLGIVGYVALPAAGAVVSVYLLTQLSGTSLIIGLAWLGIGVAYLLWLTRGFRRPTPELSIDYEQSLLHVPEHVEPAQKEPHA